eukprot:797903_1
MATLSLLFSAIYGITSGADSIEFEWNSTSGICSVETPSGFVAMSDAITDTAAQAVISNPDGVCMYEMSCEVSEWVWPRASSYSSCICPECGCDTLGAIEWVKKVTIFDSSTSSKFVECYRCECSELFTVAFGDGTTPAIGYRCVQVTADWGVSESEAASVVCPQTSCGTFNGAIKYAGNTWWNQTNSESFCVCQDDGTALCSSSYEEILSDSLLNDAFDKGCDPLGLMGICRTNASKWFNPKQYSVVCPKCGCDTTGDLGYFTKTDDDGDKSCYECT